MNQTIYVPRSVGGTLILTVSVFSPPTEHVTAFRRDNLALAARRDNLVTAVGRDDHVRATRRDNLVTTFIHDAGETGSRG